MPVVVAIPARDEAAWLPGTLAALAAQVGAPAFGVLVLANNCTDGTADVARAFRDRLKVRVVDCALTGAEAGVVGARRRALDLAAGWAGPDGVIVSTDADTCAAPDWLAQMLVPLRDGADAAAGRILLRAHERAALTEAARRTHLYDLAYRLAASRVEAHFDPVAHDPWPRHAQHFGASLALTVRAYRQVGGVPDVTALEDVALVRALQRADLTLRHTPHARVYTSARRCGRVGVGLSTQLGEWASGRVWTVPGGQEVAALARAQAALRRAYAAGPGHAACAARSLAALWLTSIPALRAALRSPTLGEALERAHAARLAAGWWGVTFRPVPVERALAELRGALEHV
ncbi:hypothetical protein GCM10008939_10830 [Deinococcus aquiradiocola]|uniref:Glycosyltransferase 2-like domain-containing protein n=1 Tax=Deinococcus aquiradiocola TaxID=393059 RepID=A0A917UMJ3_9DEIO|nr:hypothetical protein GCM10008939_10830 [Deinococcus aquiradiocola]